MNNLRERIKHGEKLCGSIVSLTDPCLCEIIGNVGYDFIWIDMEHTYISYKEVLCHLNASRSVGTPAVVRVPQSDLTVTKKILEMDPEGIIFPMVRTAEEIKGLIDMTLYPPLGNRGFGPMRAIKYGAKDVKKYTNKDSLDLCRFIQIEHIDCVDNLEEIAKIPYIDGFIFGPNDLSGSLGMLGNVFDDNVMLQINKAIKILRANGKYIGLAVGNDEETLKYWSMFDVDMITAGADWNYIFTESKKTLNRLKKYHLKGE